MSEVYNEDCMKGMAYYPDSFFDLAIVDPPYGIGQDGHNNHTRGKLAKPLDFRNTTRYDNNCPDQSYFDELFRVSWKVIIWGENYMQFNQKESSSGRIIWDKVNGENDFSDCEIAWTNLFSSVRQLEYMWNGMLQGESLLHGRRKRGNSQGNEKRIHPNHKPILLYQWLINSYAKPGWRIIDSHLGGGSHRIAAYKLGFDFWGWEIDKYYFNAQEKRFKEATAQIKLF